MSAADMYVLYLGHIHRPWRCNLMYVVEGGCCCCCCCCCWCLVVPYLPSISLAPHWLVGAMLRAIGGGARRAVGGRSAGEVVGRSRWLCSANGAPSSSPSPDEKTEIVSNSGPSHGADEAEKDTLVGDALKAWESTGEPRLLAIDIYIYIYIYILLNSDKNNCLMPNFCLCTFAYFMTKVMWNTCWTSEREAGRRSLWSDV
jgi:hypothetical protein